MQFKQEKNMVVKRGQDMCSIENSSHLKELNLCSEKAALKKWA